MVVINGFRIEQNKQSTDRTWHDEAMVGPNKQFDQDEALNKALQLFWENGYEATSMQELVDAMGINRASMYQTYGNKHALYVASIDRYIENSVAIFKQTLADPGSPLENLRGLFQLFIVGSLEGEMRGCFLNNTAIELGPHDATMAKKVRDAWVEFENVFAALIRRAIDMNEIKPDADVRQLAQLLNINLQGLLAQTKTNTAKEKLFDSVNTLIALLRLS